MTLSHKILLSMCISFSLQAMEQKPLDEYTLIHNACVNAWNTLDRYNPTDLQTTEDTSALIDEVICLKNQGIDATKIGKFAYDQPFLKPDFKNRPDLEFYRPTWCAYYPYNRYRYVSLLIPLIEKHNSCIKNNQYTPTEFNSLMTKIMDLRNIDSEEINRLAQKLYDSVKL